jgi:hypothetical protein
MYSAMSHPMFWKHGGRFVSKSIAPVKLTMFWLPDSFTVVSKLKRALADKVGICVCRLYPPKQQTFVSVANMSTMSARQVGDILLSRPIFLPTKSCRGIVSPTHFSTCR